MASSGLYAIVMEIRRNFKDLRRGILFILVIFSLAFLSYLSILTIKSSVFDFSTLGNIAQYVITYTFLEHILPSYALFFTILSAYMIAADYETGNVGIFNSMNISIGKVISGKIIFLYILLLLSLTINFSIAFLFFQNNSTFVLSPTNFLIFTIFILSFSIIGFIFIMIGLLIGVVFSKRINAVIISLVFVLSIETISSYFSSIKQINCYVGGKGRQATGAYLVQVFNGGPFPLIMHLLDPANFRSFLAVCFNFYSNYFIDINNAANDTGGTYLTTITFLPSQVSYYFIGIAIYISLLALSISITIRIKRRYF